jgi:hypothetical protein
MTIQRRIERPLSGWLRRVDVRDTRDHLVEAIDIRIGFYGEYDRQSRYASTDDAP